MSSIATFGSYICQLYLSYSLSDSDVTQPPTCMLSRDLMKLNRLLHCASYLHGLSADPLPPCLYTRLTTLRKGWCSFSGSVSGYMVWSEDACSLCTQFDETTFHVQMRVCLPPHRCLELFLKPSNSLLAFSH